MQSALFLALLFWREGSDDFLEARIAAECVPIGTKFQLAVINKGRLPRIFPAGRNSLSRAQKFSEGIGKKQNP
jgi:hypothetical protein